MPRLNRRCRAGKCCARAARCWAVWRSVASPAHQHLPKALRPAMSGVMERGSSVPLLPGIKIPVLIFNGEEDLPRPPAWSDEMARELPNAKLIRLTKIGHSPTLEAPDQVLPAIIDFYDNPRI